jgi:hypothetical protein
MPTTQNTLVGSTGGGGIAVGFNNDHVLKILSHDGTGTNDATTNLGYVNDLFTVELFWSSSGTVVSGRLNGGSLVQHSGRLPSATTDLYFQVGICQPNFSSGITALDIYGLWIDSQ